MHFYGVRKVRGAVRLRTWSLERGVWRLSTDRRDHNLVVANYLDLLAEAETTNQVKTQITYVALGNGTTDATMTDASLEDERFRKQVTAYTHGPNSGESTTTVYIAPSEANGFVINEVGWFAGDASGDAGSGVLAARVDDSATFLPLFSGNAKTNTEAVQIDRTVTYS